MSLFSAVFIFGIVYLLSGLGRFQTGQQNFLAFLRCFIMTAPLAWLYGIPVERLTEPLPATIFNFAVLLIVFFWRVALMVRTIQVLFNIRAVRAFSLIALPASVEMFFATLFKSVDIVGIMGGMRLTEAKQFLLSATQFMTMGSIVVFFVALVLLIFSRRGEVTAWENPEQPVVIKSTCWIFAVAIISMWIWISIIPQKQLSNLHDLRNLVHAEQYDEASKFAFNLSTDDLPPHQRVCRAPHFYWVPEEAIALANYAQWPEWLRERFAEQVRFWLQGHKSQSAKERSLRLLFDKLENAPHLEDFAAEFIPGIDIEIYLKPREELTKPGDQRP